MRIPSQVVQHFSDISVNTDTSFSDFLRAECFRHFNGNLKMTYWLAPENLKPEKFKKPSAKRLANKVKTKRSKSMNQKAKSSYNYRKKRGL